VLEGLPALGQQREAPFSKASCRSQQCIPGPGITRVPQMRLTPSTRNSGLNWENRDAHGEAACI
jgi:hypothetical protein